MKYVPFLKLKANEIRGYGDLHPEIKNQIIPFFDVSLLKDMTLESLCENLVSMKKNIIKSLDGYEFYMDNLEHENASFQNYRIVLETFSDLNIIPVVGLDRNSDHITAVHDFLSNSAKEKKIAIRFFLDDIQSFRVIKDDIIVHLGQLILLADSVDLIVDCRVLRADNLDYIISRFVKFIQDFAKELPFDNVIITGSSLSAKTRENIDTDEEKEIERLECTLWKKLKLHIEELDFNVVFGDYTFIPPETAEQTLDVRIMQNVMTPRIFYTFDNKFFAVRGTAFKTSLDGFKQYFGLARKIAIKPYYRGMSYSEGDNYIYEHGVTPIPSSTTSGSPSSWIRAMVNAHIVFVTNQL